MNTYLVDGMAKLRFSGGRPYVAGNHMYHPEAGDLRRYHTHHDVIVMIDVTILILTMLQTNKSMSAYDDLCDKYNERSSSVSFDLVVVGCWEDTHRFE